MRKLVNHALEADYHHSLERIGADPSGIHKVLAREHARRAGHEAFSEGRSLSDMSGHISGFPVLASEYESSFEESEGIAAFLQALQDGTLTLDLG